MLFLWFVPDSVVTLVSSTCELCVRGIFQRFLRFGSMQ